MLDLLFASTYAAEAGAKASGNPLGQFAPMIIIFVIFYFLMIRPQTKKLKDEQKMIGALGKGDEIYTKSGLIGVITGMTEKVYTLEVCEGCKVKVLKSQIGGLAKTIFEKSESKK